MSSESRRLDVIGRLGSIHRLEPTFDGAGEEQFQQSVVSTARIPLQAVLTCIDSFNLELLSGLNGVLLAEFGGQNDLALAGDPRLHNGKISSYQAPRQPHFAKFAPKSTSGHANVARGQ